MLQKCITFYNCSVALNSDVNKSKFLRPRPKTAAYKTKTKTKITRPRPRQPEVNKDTWWI